MIGSTYIQVLTIRLPADTAWKPLLAQQLMVALCALPEVTLLVRAGNGDIAWQIETPFSSVDSVTASLYSIYPDAQIERRAKQQADIGYYAYQVEATAPFYLPLAHVDEFASVDPLTGVVGAMGALGEGEAAIYSLELSPPQRNYQRIGAEQITRPANTWMRYLSPQMALQAAVYQGILGPERRVGRFIADQQRLAEQKIRLMLKEVRLTIKIRADSAARTEAIFGWLELALARLGRPGGNQLAAAYGGSHRLVLSSAELAACWHLPSDQCRTRGIAWAPNLEAAPPMELTRVGVGLRLGVSRYQGKTYPIYLPDADRVTHINLIGRTRTGKSTLLHNLIRQDILAGHGVGVIDPHGELVDDILTHSIPPQRERDVVLFDLNEAERVIGLNLLAPVPGVPVETAAAAALAVLQKFFAGDANLSRMEDTLYAALVSLMSVPGSVVQDIPRLLLDDEFRLEVLNQVTDPVALDFWELEFGPASPAQRLELARPVNHRIRKLYRSQWMRRVLGATTCLDFTDILARKRIFLANLRNNASVEGDALGALLLAKLQMAMMGRARGPASQRSPFFLYVDEVQNYVTSSLSVMLSEAAKYGMSMVIANQFLAQLEGKTLKAVLGNVGTNIIFRCSEDDAQLFAALVQPPFQKKDLVNLSRFHAVVKVQVNGQTLPAAVLETDPPPARPDDSAQRVRRIQALSRQQYGRPVEEIDAELQERYRRVRLRNPASEENILPSEMDYYG